jgi:hypothetical protein
VDGTVTLHVSCNDGTSQDVQLTVPAGSTSAQTEIGGIAVGSTCSVTETAAPPQWQPVSVTPTSVTIAPQGQPPVTITALDSVLLGNLELVKVTTVPPIVTTPFSLHVDCGTTLTTDVAISMPAGATSAAAPPITGLPFGTTCAISEPNPPPGWILQSISPSSVVVGAGGTTTATVTATNASVIATPLADLTLVKQLAGPSDEIAHDFVLHVDCTDGFSTDVTVTVPAGDTSGASVVDGITPGAECTISEPAPPTGFTLTSITPNPVTIGTPDAPPAIVTATNDQQTGSLQIIKQLSAPAASAASFGFALDCDGTDFDQNLTLDIPAAASSASATVNGLPVGLHCALTETQQPEGYQLNSITPSDAVTVGIGAPVTITALDTASLGALRIVKQLVGGVANKALPISVDVDCTNPTVSEVAQITLPPGDSTAQTLVSGLPIGALCAVNEPASPAPLTFVGISPTTVTIGVGPPVTVTVTDQFDSFNGQLTKGLTSVTPTSVTFAFTVACNDPQDNRRITLSVPVAASEASLLVSATPGNVACTLSEPESPGWNLVSRTPTDGTVTASTPTVVFVNQPETAEIGTLTSVPHGTLAVTGLARLGLLLAMGVALVLSGSLITALSTILGRRRRRI